MNLASTSTDYKNIQLKDYEYRNERERMTGTLFKRDYEWRTSEEQSFPDGNTIRKDLNSTKNVRKLSTESLKYIERDINLIIVFCVPRPWS